MQMLIDDQQLKINRSKEKIEKYRLSDFYRLNDYFTFYNHISFAMDTNSIEHAQLICTRINIFDMDKYSLSQMERE